MPRLAINVFSGVPHHITQRGNRREDVFFRDEDHDWYLNWLQEYSQRSEVEILAVLLNDKSHTHRWHTEI